MIRRRNTSNKRTLGTSVGETLVAIGILSILVGLVGQFSNHVRSGIDDLRLNKLIQWETQNARELIGSWPTDQVTQERIEAIEVSTQIEQYLSEATWQASVTSTSIQLTGIENSIPALAIKLELKGKFKGQSITPVEHHFWILNESRALSP